MKKLLFAIPLLVSLNSQASLIQAFDNEGEAIVISESCRRGNEVNLSNADKLGCSLISTLSLPTVVVASSELDPESEEIWLEILSETVAEGDDHPVSEEIARYLGKDIAEVQSAVLERYSNE